MQEFVEILKSKGLFIATMESCTGGALVNEITSIEGASEILQFSAVTYSNEYKIKMGVSKEIIDQYTVYSIETAQEMSRVIAKYAKADIGIGITGKLQQKDPNNLTGKDDLVFVSIYFAKENLYYPLKIRVSEKDRIKNKKFVVETIVTELRKILQNNEKFL